MLAQIRRSFSSAQNMTQRVYFVAHGGVVQGVGFRYFTREQANKYGVTGWCRNTRDNNVEGKAQGDENNVSQLMKDVDRGPPGSEVVKLTQEPRDVVQGEKSFTVKH